MDIVRLVEPVAKVFPVELLMTGYSLAATRGRNRLC